MVEPVETVFVRGQQKFEIENKSIKMFTMS